MRDDPYWPDFEFGPDETLAEPRTEYGGGRYNVQFNDVAFVWQMSKAEYEERGIDRLCGRYVYVQLRK